MAPVGNRMMLVPRIFLFRTTDFHLRPQVVGCRISTDLFNKAA
jgi:hypothetical protein